MALLPVYFMVNSMNDVTTYHVQVFKIKGTILGIFDVNKMTGLGLEPTPIK